jgi:hypothetical protein
MGRSKHTIYAWKAKYGGMEVSDAEEGGGRALAGGISGHRAPRPQADGNPREQRHRYRSRRDDSWVRERLLELTREKPRFGYRRLHVLLRRETIDSGGPKAADRPE